MATLEVAKFGPVISVWEVVRFNMADSTSQQTGFNRLMNLNNFCCFVFSWFVCLVFLFAFVLFCFVLFFSFSLLMIFSVCALFFSSPVERSFFAKESLKCSSTFLSALLTV